MKFTLILAITFTMIFRTQAQQNSSNDDSYHPALFNISSKFTEWNSSFSPDGKTVYYSLGLCTDTGKYLIGIGIKFKTPVYWHDAFSMKISQVPANFRSPDMPLVSHLVTKDGLIDARLIGEVGRYQVWGDKDAFKKTPKTTQQLKFLCHVWLSMVVSVTYFACKVGIRGIHLIVSQILLGEL